MAAYLGRSRLGKAGRVIEQIAQGQYLTSVAEPLVSGEVAALKALARRASNQKEAQAAKQLQHCAYR